MFKDYQNLAGSFERNSTGNATKLLHYNARQFVTLLYISWGLKFVGKGNQTTSINIDPK